MENDAISVVRERRYKITERLRRAYRDGDLTKGQIARLEAIGFEWEWGAQAPLSETHPDLAKQWHPTKNGDLTPEDVTAGSNKKVWWRHWHEETRTWHEWEAIVASRKKGAGCPYDSNKKVLSDFNGLATRRPDVAEEWHPTKNGDLTPRDVTAGSSKKVWWKFPTCGGEWKATVADRAAGRGCPYCAGKKVLVGFNDLVTKRPDLADEWHPTKNGNLMPRDVADGNGKKVWWKCNRCGHEWKAAIDSRARSWRGCPKCAKAAIGMRNAKAVVRIEDGMYFPSLKNARLDGGNASNVTRACKTGRTAYGYHWRYATEEEIAAHMARKDSDGQGEE